MRRGCVMRSCEALLPKVKVALDREEHRPRLEYASDAYGNQHGNGGVPAAHDVARKANLVLVCMFHWLLPFSHGLHSAIET